MIKRSKSSPTKPNKSLERQTVVIGRRRVPLKKMLHNQEIRVAAKNLEDFRLHFKEEEILYGAKIRLEFDTFNDELFAITERLETDQEYADRQEILRQAAEAKAERDRKRAEAQARKEERERALEAKRAEAERLKNLEDLKVIVKQMKLTDKEIVDILAA